MDIQKYYIVCNQSALNLWEENRSKQSSNSDDLVISPWVDKWEWIDVLFPAV